jgi:hypothetical protein
MMKVTVDSSMVVVAHKGKLSSVSYTTSVSFMQLNQAQQDEEYARLVKKAYDELECALVTMDSAQVHLKVVQIQYTKGKSPYSAITEARKALDRIKQDIRDAQASLDQMDIMEGDL